MSYSKLSSAIIQVYGWVFRSFFLNMIVERGDDGLGLTFFFSLGFILSPLSNSTPLTLYYVLG